MLRSWHYEGYDYALFKIGDDDYLSASREDGRDGQIVCLDAEDAVLLMLLHDFPARRAAKARILLERG